jgi:hypothetical protein
MIMAKVLLSCYCDIIFKFWNKFLKTSLESDAGMSFSPVNSSHQNSPSYKKNSPKH